MWTRRRRKEGGREGGTEGCVWIEKDTSGEEGGREGGKKNVL